MSDNVTSIGIEYNETDNSRELTLINNFDFQGRGCGHGYHHFLIDPSCDFVSCKNCDKTFNPIWVLTKLAEREGVFVANQKKAKEEMKRLDGRKRTKCQHCKKMTEIIRN